jgi:O-antigen ligase
MLQLSFNKQFLLAAILFLLFGTIALFTEYLLWLFIPFAWLLTPTLLMRKVEWLYYILFAFLPLSTEINLTPSLGLDFPDEAIMMLLTGVFVLKVIYTPSVFPKKIFYHPLISLLTIYIGWLIISCCYSTNLLLSIKFLLAKVWFIIPFVILPSIFLTNKKQFRLLALLLLIPMWFVVCQSIVRHSFYQFSFEGIKNIYSPFFRNHVNYSAMLVCLMPVLCATQRLTQLPKHKRFLTVALVIGFAAIILSYSRGAWAALLIGVLSGLAIRKNMIRTLLVCAVIALLISATWLAYQNNYLRFRNEYQTTIFHKDIKDHLQATIQLKDVSNAERFYRWAAAVNMISAKPLTGFGPNTFYSAYKSYTETPFKTWVSNNPEHSTVHNYFLLVATEQGIPGLIIFCLLYFGMIVYSQHLYNNIADRFYKIIAYIIGIILTMIGALIFMSDLVETDKIGSLFWLCLGVLIVLKQKLNDENRLGKNFE